MTSPGNDTKKTRRVSFAAPNSPNTAKPKTHHHHHPPPNPHPDPQPNSTHQPAVNDETRPPSPPKTRPEPSDACPPPPTAAPEADILAGAFTHTVTNTPHGLVIDGVLQPRGPTSHSQLRDAPPFHNGIYNNQSIPSFFHNTGQPHQANMSTVGAGMMPDPYAAHYQPPVPDTTHGPFEYTYVPRPDAAGPQYMMMNGGGGGGGPPFCAPYNFPCQQVQPQTFLPTYPPPVMRGVPVAILTNASLFRTSRRYRACRSSASLLAHDRPSCRRRISSTTHYDRIENADSFIAL